MVYSLLDSGLPLIRELWIQMRCWYKDAVERPPPPDSFSIANMAADQVDLYWHVPSPGQPIPVLVYIFLVEDSIPEDE